MTLLERLQALRDLALLVAPPGGVGRSLGLGAVPLGGGLGGIDRGVVAGQEVEPPGVIVERDFKVSGLWNLVDLILAAVGGLGVRLALLGSPCQPTPGRGFAGSGQGPVEPGRDRLPAAWSPPSLLA